MTIVFLISLNIKVVQTLRHEVRVNPLWKEGERKWVSTICLRTSVVEKMLKCVTKIEEQHEKDNRIVQSTQGFMKDNSHLTKLMELFEDVTTRRNKENPVDF